MTEFMCFILFANRFLNKVLNGIKTFFNRIKTITTLRNLFANRIKRFYSVENLVQKPVGEQDKTHEFSLNIAPPQEKI